MRASLIPGLSGSAVMASKRARRHDSRVSVHGFPHARPDETPEDGTAISEPTAAAVVLFLVALVVILGPPIILGRRDQGGDVAAEPPRFLERLLRRRGQPFLLGRVVEDGRAV